MTFRNLNYYNLIIESGPVDKVTYFDSITNTRGYIMGLRKAIKKSRGLYCQTRCNAYKKMYIKKNIDDFSMFLYKMKCIAPVKCP